VEACVGITKMCHKNVRLTLTVRVNTISVACGFCQLSQDGLDDVGVQ